MDKQTAICEYLKKHHTGKAKAVYSRALQQLFRRKISNLRKEGVPICSDATGYYYADNQKEINDTVCRMNELVTTISNARTGLLFASVLPDRGVTVEVTIKLD